MFKEMVKPAIVLTIICLVVTAALALVNGTTKPIIDEGIRKAKQEALSKVYTDASGFSEEIKAETLKSQGYQPSERIVAIYEAKSADEVAGYVVDVATKGYGGNISLLVAVDKNLTIKSTMVMSHTETPGFGSKIADGFMDQFLGNAPEGGYQVVKKPKAKDGDIQAITGATITSRAATIGVSDAVDLIRSILEGGK